MNFLDSVVVSFQTLLSHPLRSFLTLLGMIIGVSSLLIMVGIGEGTRAKIIRDIENLGGSELIILQAKEFNPGDEVKLGYENDELTLKDLDTLNKASNRIKMITPVISIKNRFAFKKHQFSGDLFGVSPQYSKIRDWPIKKGRFIIDADLKRYQKVCVLGSEISKKLFKKDNGIGEKISIGLESYTVVGIMAEREVEYGRWMNNLILIPLTSLEKRMGIQDYITKILIKAKKTEDVQILQKQIRSALHMLHKYPAKFKIYSQAEIIRTVYSASLLLRIGFGTIAIIILLVGGIGIMNLMLVSITERTREIGIRKAVGAKDMDILNQFLIEAVMISSIGCILGIIVGLSGGHFIPLLIKKLIHISIQSIISIKTIGFTIIFTTLVGTFFGVYPAIRASRLDTSQALSYE